MASVRSLVALGALAAFAACADSASGPSNVDPRTTSASPDVVTIPAAGQPVGTVDICKVVTSSGAAPTFPQTFNFNVTFSGTTTPQTINVTALNTAVCIRISTGTTGPTDLPVTVVEGAPPTNFALADLDIETWVIQPGEATTLATRTAVAVVDGDDFARVTFTNNFTPPPPPPIGCTRTQGFWKNHEELWDALSDANTATFITSTTFFNSGVSYLTIMNTPPSGGNAYLQLAHQYIAARLNIGAGAAASASVTAAIAGATAYFTSAPAGIPNPTGATRTQLQTWATLLDTYNNGLLASNPPHCPED